MNTQIKSNIEVTPAIKNYVEDKIFGKLDKFNKYVEEIVVRLNVLTNNDHEATVLMKLKGQDRFNKVSAKNNDLYASIDIVSDKSTRKVRKYKEKVDAHNVNANVNRMDVLSLADIPVTQTYDEEEYDIAKIKTFNLKPMYVEEAIAQMEMLNHNFFFYLDASINRYCVVYKRKNNTYGIIES